jgi:hypothetical protein
MKARREAEELAEKEKAEQLSKAYSQLTGTTNF